VASERIDTIETDVLVVGGGGAASRAALEARLAGAEVVLAVKGTYGNVGVRGSGSTAGGVSDRGGVHYARVPAIPGFEEPDRKPFSVQKDYENIIQLGLGMTDLRLAEIQATEAYEAMLPVHETWGAEIFPRHWGLMGHGVPIALALARQVNAIGVKVLDFATVVDLLVDDGQVAGAVAVDEKTGDRVVIRAGAVVLGTGGEGGMFRHHITASCTTGDGYAMAYRAGATLMNLEFKQLFPAIIHPTKNHFSAWFFVPHVKIYNALGEEYIGAYLPEGITLEMVYQQRGAHGPFSCRDSASRYFDLATVFETKAGRANERGALYVDLTDPRVEDPLAQPRREYFYYRGIRYLEEPIEFNIAFHCSNGGVRLDENAQSTLPGLYAAGEASAGPHGANRMAGHMLTTSQIFGRRAGRHAAARARGTARAEATRSTAATLDTIRSLAALPRGEKPRAVIGDVQALSWNTLLCHIDARTAAEARRGFAEIARHRLTRLGVRSARDLIEAIELRNMVEVGTVLTEAIDMRRESRGDHFRVDYPERDDERWCKVILATRRGDTLELTTEALDPDWAQRQRADDMQGVRWG